MKFSRNIRYQYYTEAMWEVENNPDILCLDKDDSAEEFLCDAYGIAKPGKDSPTVTVEDKSDELCPAKHSLKPESVEENVDGIKETSAEGFEFSDNDSEDIAPLYSKLIIIVGGQDVHSDTKGVTEKIDSCAKNVEDTVAVVEDETKHIKACWVVVDKLSEEVPVKVAEDEVVVVSEECVEEKRADSKGTVMEQCAVDVINGDSDDHLSLVISPSPNIVPLSLVSKPLDTMPKNNHQTALSKPAKGTQPLFEKILENLRNEKLAQSSKRHRNKKKERTEELSNVKKGVNSVASTLDNLFNKRFTVLGSGMKIGKKSCNDSLVIFEEGARENSVIDLAEDTHESESPVEEVQQVTEEDNDGGPSKKCGNGLTGCNKEEDGLEAWNEVREKDRLASGRKEAVEDLSAQRKSKHREAFAKRHNEACSRGSRDREETSSAAEEPRDSTASDKNNRNAWPNVNGMNDSLQCNGVSRHADAVIGHKGQSELTSDARGKHILCGDNDALDNTGHCRKKPRIMDEGEEFQEWNNVGDHRDTDQYTEAFMSIQQSARRTRYEGRRSARGSYARGTRGSFARSDRDTFPRIRDLRGINVPVDYKGQSGDSQNSFVRGLLEGGQKAAIQQGQHSTYKQFRCRNQEKRCCEDDPESESNADKRLSSLRRLNGVIDNSLPPPSQRKVDESRMDNDVIEIDDDDDVEVIDVEGNKEEMTNRGNAGVDEAAVDPGGYFRDNWEEYREEYVPVRRVKESGGGGGKAKWYDMDRARSRRSPLRYCDLVESNVIRPLSEMDSIFDDRFYYVRQDRAESRRGDRYPYEEEDEQEYEEYTARNRRMMHRGGGGPPLGGPGRRGYYDSDRPAVSQVDKSFDAWRKYIENKRHWREQQRLNNFSLEEPMPPVIMGRGAPRDVGYPLPRVRYRDYYEQDGESPWDYHGPDRTPGPPFYRPPPLKVQRRRPLPINPGYPINIAPMSPEQDDPHDQRGTPARPQSYLNGPYSEPRSYSDINFLSNVSPPNSCRQKFVVAVETPASPDPPSDHGNDFTALESPTAEEPPRDNFFYSVPNNNDPDAIASMS